MRIINFLKAIAKYILYGQRTTINEYINRLSICGKCYQFDNEKWACRKCGCYLDKKAKVQKDKKGKIIFDTTTKDTEIVKLSENVEEYLSQVFSDAEYETRSEPRRSVPGTPVQPVGDEF